MLSYIRLLKQSRLKHLDHSNLKVRQEQKQKLPYSPYQVHPHQQSTAHKPFSYHRVYVLTLPAPNFVGIPHKSVDLQSINIIQLLDGLFDLIFIRLDVHHEHESIIFLDLFHR